MYSIEINGCNMQSPCFYLYSITDYYIVSGKPRVHNYAGRTKRLAPNDKHANLKIYTGKNPGRIYKDFVDVRTYLPGDFRWLTFIKFRGNSYSGGCLLNPDNINSAETSGDYDLIRPDPLLNAVVYAFVPLSDEEVRGHGVAIYNKDGKPTYIHSSSDEFYYARNMRSGNCGKRLYASIPIESTTKGCLYYRATGNKGELVTAKYDSLAGVPSHLKTFDIFSKKYFTKEIFSIDPVPSSVENKLKTTERYIYVR